MYALIRRLLFSLEPERAHQLALSSLHYLPKVCFPTPQQKPVDALGLSFSHPVGLAAGLDKNAEHLDALSKLGFSYIEVGTVTPRPQIGNPRPRLFRLPKANAIINRMGFNNLGVEALLANVKKARYKGILGINIGKNKETPLEKAVDDYVVCLEKVYLHASYVTINISSPNTPDLRRLQSREYFKVLMNQLRETQLQLADIHQRYVPLVVKLCPDETDESLKERGDVVVSLGIDGIIATNTTSDHSEVLTLPYGNEEGGVSGSPLQTRSLRCLKVLKQVVGDDVTLIGVGGINNAASANHALEAGAHLLQIYTGLIYKGPELVNSLVNGISARS